MRRVITYGTFDLLHYGHINLLRRAKEQGDYLIVALSTDEFNWEQKQKKSYFSYEDRKRMLEAIRYVDLVIPEEIEHFCPDDVIFLVESGLQFHQYGNLFTIFCCLCKRCDDR